MRMERGCRSRLVQCAPQFLRLFRVVFVNDELQTCPATIATVRRVLFIIMLVLLPIQFVWGAATGYCQHEEQSAASHFGHHVHKHQGKSGKTSESDKEAKNAFGGADPDCPDCHLASIPPVMWWANLSSPEPGDPLWGVSSARQPAYIPYSIERPNWTVSA